MKSSNRGFSLAALFLLLMLASGGVYGLYKHGREAEADMVITGQSSPPGTKISALPNPLKLPGEVPAASIAKKQNSVSEDSSYTTGKVGSKSPENHSEKLKSPSDGQVNINTASLEDLEKLPGVGPAMAGRILEFRKVNGSFSDVEQLMDVNGIGEKKFAKMKPFVKVR
jgi:comEA protein